ncbi:MAG TPA: SCP2 sterol-binding domain-containing protein [Rugosimonospora sp.]|nr:SCP2 sterol-binding domain-containing protein [Rugosimonospora sp.]
MTDFDPTNLASTDPRQFAQLIKVAPAGTLQEIMRSDLRRRILDEIFSRMPGQFRPDRAGNTNAVIHWRIGDRPDGGHDTYELVIAGHECTLSPEPAHRPRLALTVGAVDFLKVISGNGNPVKMFMTRKLKARGDLSLAANIANLFRMPRA